MCMNGRFSPWQDANTARTKSSFFCKSPTVERRQFDDNQLTGTLPTELAALSSLTLMYALMGYSECGQDHEWCSMEALSKRYCYLTIFENIQFTWYVFLGMDIIMPYKCHTLPKMIWWWIYTLCAGAWATTVWQAHYLQIWPPSPACHSCAVGRMRGFFDLRMGIEKW